jgi:hypothetical protein
MAVVVTCAHDWNRDASSGGPTNVTLTCKNCGATSVSRGKVRGSTVTTTLDLYPPRGATLLDPHLYEFFIRQWEAESNSLAQSGFTVHARPPVVHTQALAGAPKGKDRASSKFVTGRDLMIAIAIVLLGGVAMLTAGIYLDVSWLKVAGGVSIGVLVFLLLLVLFLS